MVREGEVCSQDRHWDLGGVGEQIDLHPSLAPILPRNVLESAAFWPGSGVLRDRENKLYFQPVMLTQVKKSMCDQNNTARLPPLPGTPQPVLGLASSHAPRGRHSLLGHNSKTGTSRNTSLWLAETASPRVTSFTRSSDGAQACLVLAKTLTSPGLLWTFLKPSQALDGWLGNP